MKLLFFLPLLSTKGGQERTLIDKANWLVGRGHEVMLVTFENDGPLAYPLDRRVMHTDVSCPFFRIYRLPFIKRFHAALKLKKIFRERMSKTITAFSPDIIVITIPLTEFFLKDLIQVAKTFPIVIESHLAFGHEAIQRGTTERIIDFIYPPMRAVQKSNLLIALTEGDAQIWRKYHNNVRVIPNPVTYYPSSVQHAEQPKPQFRIICVGRLTPQKRFDRMIDAFATIAEKYPHYHVDIFGGGEEHSVDFLLQRIADKGLRGRVEICPPVNDIYAEYQRSDFFVLSSDFEGFGLVITEAMSCGIPVVATDCPYGPSEIIEDGKTGLLTKMDVADLAAKMEWMITHEAERQQMGKKAHEAAARYQLDRVMPEWERAYQSVLAHARE